MVGGPLGDPEPDYDGPDDWGRGPQGHRGHHGHLGCPRPADPPKLLGPLRPMGPFASTRIGEYPSLIFSTSTLGMENSLRYMGDSMTHWMEAQRYVNQTMVAHLNITAAAQETQLEALVKWVENTHQREFDKLFNAIPIYDAEDTDKFAPWLEQLQNACRVGKRDICEVTICCARGPVLEVLQSMDPLLGWSKHM